MGLVIGTKHLNDNTYGHVQGVSLYHFFELGIYLHASIVEKIYKAFCFILSYLLQSYSHKLWSNEQLFLFLIAGMQYTNFLCCAVG